VQQRREQEPMSPKYVPPEMQKMRNRARMSFDTWMNKYFAAQDRVWKAECKLELRSKQCPVADRCRDRTCRRRKRCRKVAAAALALEAARARLAAV
jgi:hypothetical protein